MNPVVDRKSLGAPVDVLSNDPKRKTISPPTQNQVARALKFQRVGGCGSPELRVQTKMETVKTPPGTGILSSPALGRVTYQKKNINSKKSFFSRFETNTNHLCV